MFIPVGSTCACPPGQMSITGVSSTFITPVLNARMSFVLKSGSAAVYAPEKLFFSANVMTSWVVSAGSTPTAMYA